MKHKVLVIEGRNPATMARYNMKKIRHWGRAWRDYLESMNLFDVTELHFEYAQLEDFDEYDFVVFGGSGLNVYNPCEASNKYTNLMLRALNSEVPIIGSCYGMQVFCHIHGAKVVRSPKTQFGTVEVIDVKTPPLISYHSYQSHNDVVIIDDDYSDSMLEVLAVDNDKTIQVVKGKHYNFLGLQHHPEWVYTDMNAINPKFGSKPLAQSISENRFHYIMQFIESTTGVKL